MSSTAYFESATVKASNAAPRIESIDIFRGLTMAVMIFVNALSDGAHGLPWWTYHAKAEWDVMTYVDMVFPFFLFIVGMSIPLSVEQRLRRHPSVAKLWLHVVIRTVSLVGLGLILANADLADASRMGISGSVWGLLGLISAALYLNVYPKSLRFPRYATYLRALGLAGVFVAFAIFRRARPDGSSGWIDTSYPEILGLIGLAYIASSILYIPTRSWRWSAPVGFVLMAGLNVCCAARIFGLPVRLPIYVWPFDNGAHVSLVMAGIVTSQIFLGSNHEGRERPPAKSATLKALLFALIVFVGGWLAIPLGISKIRATPTWSIWSISAAVIVFTMLYWICDQKGLTNWAFLLRPAGANTLLTYLLPDLWFFVLGALGISWFDRHFSNGAAGVAKTTVFTVSMLILSWVLTRSKLRLQL